MDYLTDSLTQSSKPVDSVEDCPFLSAALECLLEGGSFEAVARPHRIDPEELQWVVEFHLTLCRALLQRQIRSAARGSGLRQPRAA